MSWGWRGLKKNAVPPEDNFWNSPKVKGVFEDFLLKMTTDLFSLHHILMVSPNRLYKDNSLIFLS